MTQYDSFTQVFVMSVFIPNIHLSGVTVKGVTIHFVANQLYAPILIFPLAGLYLLFTISYKGWNEVSINRQSHPILV